MPLGVEAPLDWPVVDDPSILFGDWLVELAELLVGDVLALGPDRQSSRIVRRTSISAAWRESTAQAMVFRTLA